MYIKINVKNKIAALQDDTLIINGNSDYVIQFTFDAEWEPYETKTARFVTARGYTDVVFSGDEVALPVITDAISVRVGVYAGNLHTTTPAVIFCRRCITDGSGSPVEPTPDVYAQIMERLNNLDGVNPATTDKLGVVKIGDNLKITNDGVLSVDTADAAEQDNTRPITSAAVYTAKSNIEALLGNLNDLTTGAKNNLVAAINEAAQTGGGGGGSTVELDTTLTQSGKAADAKATGDAIRSLSEEIANLSGGLNSTAKSLLITILRDGIYNTNQSANITALSVALENTGGDNPSIPTESISIAGDTTVNFGKTLILTATLTPSNTTDSVVWTSSNETIATVTGSGSKNTVGTVTGIKGGTVTIRAIAGSVSTTYTVTVVENVSLPDGYTALDYIVSNWKSSFDTGITADENTTAEYKISFIQLGAVHVLADNGAYAFPASASGGRVRSKRGGTDYNYSYTLSTDTIYTIKAFAENSVNVNGINIDTKSVVGNTPSGNGTLIFNNYGSVNNPYGATAKYYYMKIWEGEDLIRWYIPCKDTNGTVGMYDAVGNTFNTKTVTGESFTEA